MRAVRLRTAHMINPMGIDFTHPEVSWSDEGGIRQSAYQVVVRDQQTEKPLYDTGRVESSLMHCELDCDFASREPVEWQVRLWDEEGVCGDWSETASFEMGLLERDDWEADWILPEPENFMAEEDAAVDAENAGAKDKLKPKPYPHRPVSSLRRTFDLSCDPRHTRLYIAAHGIYMVYINGKKVGNDVLAPGAANYDRRAPYRTYDIADLCHSGTNEVTVLLADGWYRSCSGTDGERNLFGSDLAVLLQIEEMGQVICVSDSAWSATQEGPWRMADLQMGETFDARRMKALDPEVPSGAAALAALLDGWHDVRVASDDGIPLTAADTLPIVEREHFRGTRITTPDGGTVIDFGQNLAGFISFELTAHEGDVIRLICGETLDENSCFTQENFQDRKRHREGGVAQTITYICREGRNRYKTQFAIMGFRYAEVKTSIDLRDATFESIAVYSDMEDTLDFTTANADVAQLVHNAHWSMKGNFCDIPTDCPTRERAGWTGDSGVFVAAGLDLMDAYPVYRHWLDSCRELQHEDGRVANIAPRNNTPGYIANLLAGSVGWGDAAIIVPYTLWKHYGDTSILRENYDMMCRWYAYLETRAKQDDPRVPMDENDLYREYTITAGIDYGEWCEPGSNLMTAMSQSQYQVSTAYFAHSGRLLAEIAEALGETEDASHYASVSEKAAEAYRRIVLKDGRIVSDHQADYVRPLAFGLLEGETAKQAAADLNQMVVDAGYHLNTGFLSTPYLCEVLVKYGYSDTAEKLLLQEEAPGWLYEVKRGATTVWETWDGVRPDGTVHDSLNHYSYGAIAGWLVRGVCGIEVEGESLRIAPVVLPALGSASARLMTPLGEVVSRWTCAEDGVHYHIEVPANVAAEVTLPDGTSQTLTAGAYSF